MFSLRSLLSVVERLARRDGLSAMAVSVLVLMEDRPLCALICAPSYLLICSANLPFTGAHSKFVDYFRARALSTVVLSKSSLILFAHMRIDLLRGALF